MNKKMQEYLCEYLNELEAEIEVFSKDGFEAEGQKAQCDLINMLIYKFGKQY